MSNTVDINSVLSFSDLGFIFRTIPRFHLFILLRPKIQWTVRTEARVFILKLKPGSRAL